MSLDVNELEEAQRTHDGVWVVEAHGVSITYQEHPYDPELRLWVSPIWNMRQKGVALVDSSGQMVKNERRDR